MKNKFSQEIKIIVLGLILSIGVGTAFAWTDNASTAPTNNVAAPINTTAAAQTKAGILNLDDLVVANTATFLKKLAVGNLKNTSNKNVCADTDGKLILCTTTAPAASPAQANFTISEEKCFPTRSNPGNPNETVQYPNFRKYTFTSSTTGGQGSLSYSWRTWKYGVSTHRYGWDPAEGTSSTWVTYVSQETTSSQRGISPAGRANTSTLYPMGTFGVELTVSDSSVPGRTSAMYKEIVMDSKPQVCNQGSEGLQ